MSPHPPKLTDLAEEAKFFAITEVTEEYRGWTVESNSVTLAQGPIYCVLPIGVAEFTERKYTETVMVLCQIHQFIPSIDTSMFIDGVVDMYISSSVPMSSFGVDIARNE